MLWDTHMHTHFSGDSDALPMDMVQAAIHCNLDGICITDHLDYDYREEPDLFLLDLPRYEEGIRTLQAQFEGIFPIRFGIEIGLQPHVAADNRKVTETYPFDFVIGSSHVVHHVDPYYGAFYENRTEEEAYLEYFESILENLDTDADFDVYGHLDYVVRYGPNTNKYYSYHKYADVIDEILKKLLAKGKGIELNTAGFKYGLGHPNPTEEILKRYRELGGEILTIGADAHKPEHVAYAFDQIANLLKETGFSYYTVFRNRTPEFLPLT